MSRVTQADRDAAKSLLGRDDAGPSWWSIDSGNADNDRMVQAFAAHREAAARDERARNVILATEEIIRICYVAGFGAKDANMVVKALATAIEKGKHDAN